MKKLSKIVSVVLSLALCLGMASPAFAAVALEKDKHIDGTTGALLSHDEQNEAGETVKSYDYYLENDVTLDKTLVVSDGVNASIDLNGHKLQLNDSNEVQKDEAGYTVGVTAGDSSGQVKTGSVIKVTGEGTNLTVTDAGVDGIEKGEGTGTITGGNNQNDRSSTWVKDGGGGGVSVIGGAKFQMSGGQISGNISKDGGGGIAVVRNKDNGLGSDGSGQYKTSISLKNVEICDNAESNTGFGIGGGGVYVDSWCTGTLTDTDVVNNYAAWAGGGVYGFAEAEIAINGGHISGNTSVTSGGGVRVLGKSHMKVTLEMNDVTLNENRIIGGSVYTDGGAIAGENCDITLNNITAFNNTAPGKGGGVQTTKDVQLTLKGSNLVYGNSGKEGNDLHIIGEIAGDGTINKELPVGYLANEDNLKNENQWIAGWSKHENHNYQVEVTKQPSCTEAGEETYTCGECGESHTEVIPASHGEGIWTVTTPAQPGVEGVESLICPDCGVVLNTRSIPALPVPAIPDNGGADATPDAATIADQEVPLAGLMPLYMLLEELRQHEKIPETELPEDFKWIDHEYAQAIYWGLQEELVVDTEEEPLDPDEVITVAILRDVLVNFVEYKEIDLTVTLAGEDDAIVFDLGERLTAFYGELDAYLENQKDLAA